MYSDEARELVAAHKARVEHNDADYANQWLIMEDDLEKIFESIRYLARRGKNEHVFNTNRSSQIRSWTVSALLSRGYAVSSELLEKLANNEELYKVTVEW